ncbi:hypothetical protein AB205_0122590 [Aquarana catesbeiana]|uniref:Uncharacterized protein n=1 Tax=Aquarana catesbeiana TaxID=8400 RepID=A0A2G9SF87_AQUCT|nr:hypothetical protein AB205_0122590 [Aquarana catesbeiana]
MLSHRITVTSRINAYIDFIKFLLSFISVINILNFHNAIKESCIQLGIFISLCVLITDFPPLPVW